VTTTETEALVEAVAAAIHPEMWEARPGAVSKIVLNASRKCARAAILATLRGIMEPPCAEFDQYSEYWRAMVAEKIREVEGG
jgi:hypothetical protein